MDKNPTEKPASNVPEELRELLRKYGCSLRKEPTYIILGTFIPEKGRRFMGILAGVDNEFHTHLIAREVRKTGGNCEIHRTEHHPDGMTFSVADYMRDVKELRERRATANAQKENRPDIRLVNSEKDS